MNESKTVKCPICGEPYIIMMFYAGDQSACPRCRERARKNMGIGGYEKQP